jgi:hypothetical protein
MVGVDLINAASPTIASTLNVALGAETPQAGASATQSAAFVKSALIPGGSFCAVWISVSDANSRLPYTTISAAPAQKHIAYTNTPTISESNAWNNDTRRYGRLKVGYRRIG